MTSKKLARFGLIIAVALPLCPAYGQGPAAPAIAPAATAAPATNFVAFKVGLPSNVAEVVKLTKAGMGEDVILAYVNNSQSSFNLKADDILELKGAGVSSAVIAAMLNHNPSALNQAQGPPPNAPAPYVYNQQFYPPNGQYQPGQQVAQPYAPQAQPYGGPPPPDMSTAQQAPPPPPQPDVVTVAPGPDYYWAPGYWGWNGGWIWIGGGWYPHGYGWGYRGWGGYYGYRGGWGGYRGGGGFRGGHR